MTENGNPYEHAVAERVNRILKAEFDLHSSNLALESKARAGTYHTGALEKKMETQMF